MLIMSVFGPRSVVVVLAFVAVLDIATTMFLMQQPPIGTADRSALNQKRETPARPVTAVIMLGFITLQASNVAAMSIMSLFVVETLQLDIAWAGVALGLAAALEILALLVIGVLRGRVSSRGLVISGCVAGIAYGAGMTLVHGPVTLLASLMSRSEPAR